MFIIHHIALHSMWIYIHINYPQICIYKMCFDIYYLHKPQVEGLVPDLIKNQICCGFRPFKICLNYVSYEKKNTET